jgi:hypothetical protein
MGYEVFPYSVIQTSLCVLISMGGYGEGNQTRYCLTALVLGSYGPSFLEPRFHAQAFQSLRSFKKHLSCNQFVTDADMKQAVTSWLHTLGTDSVYAGIQTLLPRWHKCLYVSNDHFGVWCVPSATHVPCVDRSQNKVLDIGGFVDLFFSVVLLLTCSSMYAVC